SKNPRFDRIILTKSMDSVGGNRLGAVPGDIGEKFNPYLINFKTTFEQMYPDGGLLIDSLERAGKIMYLPIQLMRGASFVNTLVIVDEAQNLGHHETKTIGTRLGEGSSLIILGDLTQIDRKNLRKEKTGLYHLMHSDIIKKSGMAAGIELIKNVRSPLSNLIDEAFVGTDNT
ncbi:MAG: PhoH family protein, partial [Nitrososphaeraceae archaeon]|nr:PhoH family protein [Nitrososphaeraceae archaeon]